MEVCGTLLAYQIALRSGRVWLSASLMDSAREPQVLNVGDSQAGWKTVCRLVQRNGIKLLEQRPLEIGKSGPEAGAKKWKT